MRRSPFVKLVQACEANCRYFTQRRNVAGLKGFSAYQKISAAMRVIAYGVPADYADEYLRIGEDTTIESVRRFAKVIIRVFGPEYLRAPNEDDTKKLMASNERRGWPGMLGSIDCMHWTWKNCPKAWQGMYCGKSRDATIVLEAVASEDLWIWHCFFGMTGTLNDINVLQRSHLFARLASGDAPACNYTINGHEYTKGYYLADGIYPPWCTFVKSIKEAFDRYLGDGKPFYIPRTKTSPKEAIELIKQADGIPVLAHLMLYKKLDSSQKEALVRELKDAGLIGIETYYNTYTPVEQEYVAGLAKQWGLIETGGTDFHGQNKPHISLFTGQGEMEVPQKVLENLKY